MLRQYNQTKMKLHSSVAIKDFFSQYKFLQYKKRETILFAQDIPQGVYLITNGYVKSYTLSKEGKEIICGIYHKSNIFSLSWALTSLENPYYFETLTAVDVWRAPQDTFLSFIQKNPTLLLELTISILTEFTEMVNRMNIALSGSSQKKVISLLVLLAGHYGIAGKNDSIIVQIPLAHRDIAALLGMSRETVSLELKHLQDRTLIAFENHILVIKQLPKLVEKSM